ncbi:LPS assembly lipoprotein LptE [Pseudoroseomonas globiformis]|uniref:LPS assembly lipoprotein LptE n=1 Tax=Teichococcus globiformis TaxID=2307229 RepID=A0ABV7G1Y8_9PROT
MRRRLLLGAVGLGVAGCGFRPLHAPGGATAAGEASDDVRAILASTEVALIPERNGQMLRRALTERLSAAGSAATSHDLRVSLQASAEPEGFRRDGTPSRIRMVMTGSWLLVDRAAPPSVRAQGVERAFDAFDIPDNQFFAGDAAQAAMSSRLISQLADDIVLRLTVSLRSRSA